MYRSSPSSNTVQQIDFTSFYLVSLDLLLVPPCGLLIHSHIVCIFYLLLVLLYSVRIKWWYMVSTKKLLSLGQSGYNLRFHRIQYVNVFLLWFLHWAYSSPLLTVSIFCGAWSRNTLHVWGALQNLLYKSTVTLYVMFWPTRQTSRTIIATCDTFRHI